MGENDVLVVPGDSLPGRRLAQEGVAYAQHCITESPGGHPGRVRLESHLLSFLQRGRKRILDGVLDLEAEAGDVVFIRRGAYLGVERLDEGTFEAVMFFLEDDFLADLVAWVPELHPGPDPDPAPSPAVCRLQQGPALRAAVGAVLPWFEGAAEVPGTLRRLKMAELLVHLLQADDTGRFRAALSAALDGRHLDLRRVMERDFLLDLPLEGFARRCHRSLSAFKRDFRAAFGESPREWLVARRLERARDLLHPRGLGVTEVAHLSGFESDSHFIQRFRRAFGITPKQFQLLAQNR